MKQFINATQEYAHELVFWKGDSSSVWVWWEVPVSVYDFPLGPLGITPYHLPWEPIFALQQANELFIYNSTVINGGKELKYFQRTTENGLEQRNFSGKRN